MDRKYFGGFIKRNGTAKFPCGGDAQSERTNDIACEYSGFNPTKRTNNPITLNYTHQENMFELWNMIDYGSQFEQNLQYKLYKQLDKDK